MKLFLEIEFWVYHLLVFPLSSRMVIGRSSFILSIAAGQSNLKREVNTSTDGNSSPWTCLKAALNWTRSLEQAAVYSLAVTESLMYAFSRHCIVLMTAYKSAILSYLENLGKKWNYQL